MDGKKPEWFKDKVYGRMSNIESPGSAIVVDLNGVREEYIDGFEGFVPKGHVDVINEAVAIEHRNQGMGLPTKEIRKPRFLFSELMPPDGTKSENDLVGDIMESKREAKSETKKSKTERVTNDVSGDVQQGDL